MPIFSITRIEFFLQVAVNETISFTATCNKNSMRLMEKIGMTHQPADDFLHPALADGDPLKPHVLYRIAAQV